LSFWISKNFSDGSCSIHARGYRRVYEVKGSVQASEVTLEKVSAAKKIIRETNSLTVIPC